MLCRNGFTQLVQGPCSCGRSRHIRMEKSAAGVFNDHEHREETKGRRDGHTEVAGHDRLRMVAHKRCPALGWQTRAGTSFQRAGHILPHGSRRDPQAELQQQFVRNALLTPGRIVMRHATDKRLQVRRDRRAPRLRLPAPKQTKSLAMPMEKGLGLNDSEDLAPIEPVTEPDQRKAGRCGSTSWRLLAFLVEGELLTEKEILCSQRRAGTQAEIKETQAVVEEGQQGTREL
jgi:hypothetical protein